MTKLIFDLLNMKKRMELYRHVKIAINARTRTQDSNHLNYVKVKVKAFILSTPRRCIEGAEGQLQLFLKSALDVSEGLADLSLGTNPCPLSRRVRGPQCRSGRFGTETNLSFHYSDLNPGPPSPQSYHYYFLAV